MNQDCRRITQLLIVAFLCSGIGYSYVIGANADSLLNVLQSASGVEKYKALRALGKFYKTTDLAKSLDYAGQQRNMAIEMKNRKLEAEAMSDMAIPIILM